MVEQNKKLLYIHSKNLNYYENDQIFSLINTYKSYIMVDKIKIGKLFTEYNECINAKYKKIISDKLYYIANLKSILKKLTPNVVVTREIFSLASFQVHLLKKKFDFIHIIIVYENTNINKSLWGVFPLTRFISSRNKNSIFVSTSHLATKNLLKIKVPKEHIIETFTGLFPVMCDHNIIMNKSFRILYIGNLYKNKGIITLIKAFNDIMNDGYRDIYLFIAGSGDLTNFVRENEKKIKNLVYLGYVSESEKEKLLSHSDVFVYPSEDIDFLKILHRWAEQGAIAVIEAMRCGVPIITSNSGSLPEIIGRNDVIFNQGNSIELKNKLLMLYKNRDLLRNLKIYNINRFNEQFNIYKNANKIYNRIKDL